VFESDGEYLYLTLEALIGIHGLAIGVTANQAADRLVRPKTLEDALARPRNAAHYEDADLALQSAYLVHGIAEARAFIDGNKRTAAIALATYTAINGRELDMTDDELYDLMLQLATGTDVYSIAKTLRKHL